jgi:hypothetical protein
MIWAGHVARMGESRSAYKFSVVKLKEEDCLEEVDVDGKLILK